ncbi:MAG: nitric oxide reductase activation protein [Pseudomonadota bacterium]|jgi:nitric oxide reductase NorD protein
MEEWVGGIWDRWITRKAEQRFPEAAVHLAEMNRSLSVFFRGLGGDPGLQVQNATSVHHGSRRRWLARIAGTGQKTQPASIDGQNLRLPDQIAAFPERQLNRELYLWLAALAAHDVPTSHDEPLIRNQRATVVTLDRFPALLTRYQRLVEACIALRIPADQRPSDEAAQETAIQQALRQPGSIPQLPHLRNTKSRPIQPVPMWLWPVDSGQALPAKDRQHQDSDNSSAQEHQGERKKAERVDAPESEHGLLMIFRAESLFSWAEFVRVNRSLDDDPDPNAGAAADSIDKMSVMQDGERVASRVKFELDLPAAGEDDLAIGEGILLPEWDYRKQRFLADHCCLQYLESRDIEAIPLPEHLRAQARRLRSQFAVLAPTRRWQKAQQDGTELDLDAWVRQETEARTGHACATDNRIYQAQVQQERDLACLVLADLSLSTDASANDHQKVIDVIRDSLMLFAEALGETGDNFALCGFSSLKRNHIRFHALKTFEESYSALARGHIAAIRPGYYTRLGAAIRHSTRLLAKQPNRQRLLLILSDGKPHDLDVYESRYGIEDTRQSILEAHEKGVHPFCITIDREGGSYLPHMFGANGYTLLRRADELSQKLPMLYAQLTQV